MSKGDLKFLAMVSAIGLILVAVLCWRGSRHERSNAPPSLATLEAAGAIEQERLERIAGGPLRERVTKSNFKKLQVGMTLPEAEVILGPGRINASYDIPTVGRMQHVHWSEHPRAIDCEFLNGLLKTKLASNF